MNHQIRCHGLTFNETTSTTPASCQTQTQFDELVHGSRIPSASRPRNPLHRQATQITIFRATKHQFNTLMVNGLVCSATPRARSYAKFGVISVMLWEVFAFCHVFPPKRRELL